MEIRTVEDVKKHLEQERCEREKLNLGRVPDATIAEIVRDWIRYETGVEL